MWWRTLGCAVLGLSLVSLGWEAGAGEKDKAVKDKVAKDKDDVKERPDPRKNPKAVVGKMKSVDQKGEAFTIIVEGGKDRTFTVIKETEFIGPRGGVSDERLKDDRLEKGYEVVVIPTDAKTPTAREVHMGYRKKAEPAKDKSTPKDKGAKDKGAKEKG
jgi:hypothetical protein